MREVTVHSAYTRVPRGWLCCASSRHRTRFCVFGLCQARTVPPGCTAIRSRRPPERYDAIRYGTSLVCAPSGVIYRAPLASCKETTTMAASCLQVSTWTVSGDYSRAHSCSQAQMLTCRAQRQHSDTLGDTVVLARTSLAIPGGRDSQRCNSILGLGTSCSLFGPPSYA